MKVEVPVWVTIAGILVVILLAVMKPTWDLIAPHMLSINSELPVMELEGKVEQVRTIETQLRSLISSEQEQRIEFDSSDKSVRVRWLRSVDQLVQKENNIKDNLAQCGTNNYYKRYKISRQAEMEIKIALNLITQGEKLIPVQASSHPVQQEDLPVVQTSLIVQADSLPPVDVVQANSCPVQSEEVRVRSPLPGMESIYNKVLSFISDKSPESVSLRVWGMGGVGNLVRDSHPLYNEDFTETEVLFVQAGKGCTKVADLQKVISDSLRLGVVDNETSQAGLIHKHLKDKSFLLLLDDLWMDFDLEEVGIPSLQRRDNQPHRRKVFLTTRSMDVKIIHREEEKENIIQMKCLNKEDAWNLFAGNVENAMLEDAEIRSHAEEIVKACSGLPMALCAIGKFMSSKKDTRGWRTTTELLNKSKLHEITDIHAALLQRLKDSYDNLKGDMRKRLLVCSLWPENGNISMKTLTRWWTGLGLLDVSSNASDIGYTYIEELVHLSILEKGNTGLDSTENSHVKMHNMTRMMALWIVNERGYMDRWLPKSSYRLALSEDKWCNVEKAWVSQEDTSNWCDWSSNIHCLQLKMLVAQDVLSSLQLIHNFRNITFLDLEGVTKDLPDEIGTLIQLQHLNLSESTSTVCPTVLLKLLNLKYLYMRNNMSLQAVPKGFISALRELQGLDLFCNGASLTNVLHELVSSKRCLDMLGFTVQTIAEITDLGQLKNVCTQALCIHQTEDTSNPDIINLIFLSKLGELRELAIVQSFQSQKVFVAEGDGPEYKKQLLPHLEVFELKNILKLEKVMWKNAGVDIRVVSIYKCDGLKDVTWVHHLKKLEQLTVASCKEMERLIETPELSQGEIVAGFPNVNQMVAISFPVLKKVELEDLAKLSMISQQACKFEQLSYICVTRCNEMKGIHEQEYEQMVSIHCSEGWWTENIPVFPKEHNTHLVPTFAP